MYRVLLVDDEEIALEAMRRCVQWEKLQISDINTATNIQDAKEILLQKEIDVLICDIEMPNGTGMDLVKWMREKEKDSICIFLTCHSQFEYAKNAVSLGVFEYMLKPVDGEELAEVIGRAIQNEKKNQNAKQASLMLEDLSHSVVRDDTAETKNQQILEETKAYIRKNIGREITRTEIAEHVYLNPDYLSRILKKDTGYSISEYILKVRIGVASELLVKTELSVSKIAMSCGYTHMAHFSKMFKKETGYTPNQYRVRYRA